MFNTPFKIQGKKTELVDDIMFLAKDLIDNKSVIDTWVEPFLGSGIVAFNCPGQIKKVICGDINPYIIDFYKSIQSGSINDGILRKWLTEESEKLKTGGNEYYLEVREKFNKTKDPSLFFLLNRICFNGVIRFNKKGEFNVPFCKNPNKLSNTLIDSLCENVKQLSELFKTKEFVFLCQSYEDTLKLSDEHSIIYCDPPYYGLNDTYYEQWGKDFEIKLNSELKNIESSKIVSTWKTNNKGENNYMIDQYWGDYNIKLIDHRYIVGQKKESRGKVVEALMYK